MAHKKNYSFSFLAVEDYVRFLDNLGSWLQTGRNVAEFGVHLPLKSRILQDGFNFDFEALAGQLLFNVGRMRKRKIVRKTKWSSPRGWKFLSSPEALQGVTVIHNVKVFYLHAAVLLSADVRVA